MTLILPATLKGGFPSRDEGFFRRVFAKPLEDYQRRLAAVGFSGLGRVLDAGAGFGQWALAATPVAAEVVAVDRDPRRVAVLSEIRDLNRIRNLRTAVSDLGRLPFPGGAFDGVFCYGVIFYTDVERTLGEFARVLRPGGLLYVSSGDVGAYLQLLVKNPHPSPDYSARRYAWKALVNSALGRPARTAGAEPVPVITRGRRFRSRVRRAGFDILGFGGEGTVSLRPEIKPVPNFAGSFWGFRATFECVARKV